MKAKILNLSDYLDPTKIKALAWAAYALSIVASSKQKIKGDIRAERTIAALHDVLMVFLLAHGNMPASKELRNELEARTHQQLDMIFIKESIASVRGESVNLLSEALQYVANWMLIHYEYKWISQHITVAQIMFLLSLARFKPIKYLTVVYPGDVYPERN